MYDFRSITVYVAEMDIPRIKELCEELPYLSCVYDSSYPDGMILEEKVYPVDLMFDVIEGD